jgi:transcriptional antiterminator RfaH
MAVGWYVAAIQRGKESALKAGLAQYGVDVYNPDIVVVKRGKKLREPLFPCYLFCLLDPQSEQWPQIRWAKGLRYFLGPSRQPTPVANSLIEEIRARAEGWNRGGWEFAFAPGQQVRISDGALSGMEAIFSRYLPGRQRCEVLVSLVGRSHCLPIPTLSLEARHPAGFLA